MVLFHRRQLSNYVKITSAFFLLGVLISFSLWTNDRNFPVFPLIEQLTIPTYAAEILKYGFIGLLVTLTCSTKRIAIVTLLTFLLLLIVTDQMRLQPWVYFYGLLLVPFTITKNKDQIVNYLRVLFVMVYLWSGVHKLNPNFEALIFESILIDGFGITNSATLATLKPFSVIVASIEILAAIFLFIHKTRNLGVYLAVFSHVFILYYLIFGLKGNWVIVPWNAFMILSVVALFYNQKEQLSIPFKNRVLTGVLVIVFLLPFGFYSGHIDQRLSFSLYDGQLKSLYDFNEGSDTHYEVLQNHIDIGSIIDYNVWAYEELEVPFYPEERFIQKIKKEKIGTLVLTTLPLWERNIKGTFKTSEELTTYDKVFGIGKVKFDTIVYFPKYQVLK